MVIDPDELHRVVADLLEAFGAPAASAAAVAAALVGSDRRGVGTHGVALLPLYARMIREGAIDVSAEPELAVISAALAKVNGRGSFGHLTGAAATRAGIDLAAAQGIAAVAIEDGGHLGRLGQWAESACAANLVFLAFSNAGGGARNVAAFGTHERVLSTNPVAFGFPVFGALPHDVIVDFATCQVSGSSVRDHYKTGTRLDPEWTVSLDGTVTDDPELFMEGLSVLLPLGGRSTGHKGYGLAVAAELLGGIAGGRMAGEGDDDRFSNAAMFLFLDPAGFAAREAWAARVRNFAAYLAGKGARLPGSGAGETAARDKVEIPDHAVDGLKRLAAELGVMLPESLKSMNPERVPPDIGDW